MKRQVGRLIGTWVLVLAILLAVSVATMFMTGTVQRLTAEWRGETDMIEDTEGSGEFQRATYEQFFNLCQSVQSAEGRITSLETELEGGVDASHERTIDASLTAIRSGRAESIDEYNSLAAQEHTGAFQDAGLPDRLEHDTEETECEQ